MGDKTKIDWCDSTWNPVTGCLHGCEYCYARGIARRFGGHLQGCIEPGNYELVQPMYDITPMSNELARVGRKLPYPYDFEPTFHRYKLEEPKRWKKPRTIFVCSMADLFGEWVPEMWIKANPNLGQTVTYETYAQDVETAELNPTQRNEIIAKRFGIPLEGTTYFFTYEETLPHPKQSFWQMPCSLGCDLSQGDDFCAFTFLFPLRNGSFGVKCRAYISERTQMKLSPAAREKYDEFIAEGTLIVQPGSVLDMMMVYDDLIEHITDCQYEVLCMGYDPYNAEKFVERWTQENGNFGNVFKVRQGKRTESVPLGELKQLAEDRALIFDEELMVYAMGNAQIEKDVNNNKMLCKRRNDEKIDPVSAMMDAYVAFTGYRDNFD